MRSAITIALLMAPGLLGLVGVSRGSAQSTPRVAPPPIAPYLGRWDLTLQAPGREYASWLEIREENGRLAARLTARWGNARRLPEVELTDVGILLFRSPKEEEKATSDMVYRGRLTAGLLKGTVNGPDGTQWQWTGAKAPQLKRSGTPKWGKPIQLFDGKNLAGWEPVQVSLSEWRAKGAEWTVQDGSLISPSHGPELVSGRRFKDFKLHVEFNCGRNSNSGVFLRGRYETQIEIESAGEPPTHHTGGIYGFLAPTPEQPSLPDTWQTFDIILIGRRITVIQNRHTVISNKEIPGLTGGALDSDEGLPGPIYLQGSEQGHVRFRNLVLTPAVT